jgi:hypothetical protein
VKRKVSGATRSDVVANASAAGSGIGSLGGDANAASSSSLPRTG